MRNRIFLSLVLILVCVGVIAAQDKKPMQPEDLFAVRAVGESRLSPDGSAVLFTVASSDWESNGMLTHIWRVPTAGGEPEQLTRGDKSCSSPRWSPDGKTIAFTSGRGGENQIWFMRVDGGEAWQVTKHKPAVSRFDFSPDGARLYFLAADPKTAAEEQRVKDKNTVRIFGKDDKNVHLWEYDIAAGSEKKLTDGDFSIRDFKTSPGGDVVAFTAAPTSHVDDNLKIEIRLLTLADNSIKPLTDNRITEGDLEWSPDGASLTFVSDSSSDLKTYHQRSIFITDRSGARPVDMLPDFPKEVQGHQWFTLDGAQKILFAANMGVNRELFLYDVATRKVEKQLTDGVGGYGFVDAVPRG